MREAPGVEQFVRQNAKKIDVIGLGTQDSLSLAKTFITRTKVKSFPMLWDMTGTSWAQLGVPSQPAWMLIAANGTVIDGRLGPIPYKEILTRIG